MHSTKIPHFSLISEMFKDFLILIIMDFYIDNSLNVPTIS